MPLRVAALAALVACAAGQAPFTVIVALLAPSLAAPMDLPAPAAAWNDDGGEPCSAPGVLSTTAPNILTIGDSISMCGYGYGHFVNDMLVQQTGGTLAGYASACGQMASSSNGAEKMTKCIGNSTGTLKPKAFSVITYNAGLHDCDTTERVLPDAYRANVKAVLETLKPAAAAVAFTTTTPYDMPTSPAGINMSCVLEYNTIAKEVAAEVGGVTVIDLYAHVERFCQQSAAGWPPLTPDRNYSVCAIQSNGLHFYTSAPQPSGQQYTGLHIAAEAARLIPNAHINNGSKGVARVLLESSTPDTMSCGNPAAPLSTKLPNVLIIGDSISEPGSGYGPGVEQLLMRPGVPWRNQSGPLASVQHSGNTGSNQAGPTTNGVSCIMSWLGDSKWDVITINFGIHDCCGPTENVTKAQYVQNLGVIYSAAHAALAPGGTILWVSTTPVPTVGVAPQKFTCGRTGADFNGCVDDYNAAALTLLGGKPDVQVLDLNDAVSAVCGKPYAACNLQLWQNVHFTTAGKQFCAVQVAHAVARLLAPKWDTLCKGHASDHSMTCA